MSKYGEVGQEVFDMFCEDASAEEIEACLYRHLPSVFGEPGYYCSEVEGFPRKVDVWIASFTLTDVTVPEDVGIPEWASRFLVNADFRLRFKPERGNRAIMLPTIEVEASAESRSVPPRNEKLVHRRFRDIDEALEEMRRLVR